MSIFTFKWVLNSEIFSKKSFVWYKCTGMILDSGVWAPPVTWYWNSIWARGGEAHRTEATASHRTRHDLGAVHLAATRPTTSAKKSKYIRWQVECNWIYLTCCFGLLNMSLTRYVIHDICHWLINSIHWLINSIHWLDMSSMTYVFEVPSLCIIHSLCHQGTLSLCHRGVLSALNSYACGAGCH